MPEGNKILSRNIRKARIKANLTQQKAAELLNITPLHYGRLERGDRRASIEQVDKIAQIFSVSPFSLFEGCFEAYPPLSFDDPDLQTMLDQLAVLLHACTADERKLCFDICKRIAKGR